MAGEEGPGAVTIAERAPRILAIFCTALAAVLISVVPFGSKWMRQLPAPLIAAYLVVVAVGNDASIPYQTPEPGTVVQFAQPLQVMSRPVMQRLSALAPVAKVRRLAALADEEMVIVGPLTQCRSCSP